MLNIQELKQLESGASQHLKKAPSPLQAMWGSLLKKVAEVLAYYVPREKLYLETERMQHDAKKLADNAANDVAGREQALKVERTNVETLKASIEGREQAVRDSQQTAAQDRQALNSQKLTQDEREKTLVAMDARLSVKAQEQAEMERTLSKVTELQLAKTRTQEIEDQRLESDRLILNKIHADRVVELDQREASIQPRIDAVAEAERANQIERSKLTNDVLTHQEDKKRFEKIKKDFYDRNVDVQAILDEDAREQKEIDRLRVEADDRERARQDRLRQLPGGGKDLQS